MWKMLSSKPDDKKNQSISLLIETHLGYKWTKKQTSIIEAASNDGTLMDDMFEW